MKEAVVIVAGGKGSRFGSQTPKQFLLINGLPVYIHTIGKFFTYNKNIFCVLVIPESTSTSDLQTLQSEINVNFSNKVNICKGGSTRFQSVKNGLAVLPNTIKTVAIHDAVRPLVSVNTITTCFNTATQFGNAIPVMPVVSSLRKVSGIGDNKAVERSLYRTVQTPQCFLLKDIREAYTQDESKLFTDDASVAESAGHKIKLVDGNLENIKITTPPDLLYAKYLLSQITQ